MKDLGAIRGEIDRIDDALADLLKRRLEIVGDIVAAKRENGVPVSDPRRESEIIARVAGRVGPGNEDAARVLFTTLFGITKARQTAIMSGGLK